MQKDMDEILHLTGESFIFTLLNSFLSEYLTGYIQGDRLRKQNHGYGNSSGEKFYPAAAGFIPISKSNYSRSPVGEKLGPKLNAFINSTKG